MNIEIINTGSELLLGRVLNTHQQWICRRMTDLGYEITRQTTVADDAVSIELAVRESLGRADLVIVTGGLGPTSDDITRERIAALLGRKLNFERSIMAKIEAYFVSRNRTVPPQSELQAMVPEGARVLPNGFGTAPGLAMELNPNPQTGRRAWLILLPGPPRELHPMFDAHVVPLLQSEMPPEQEFACKTFRSHGVGESVAQAEIEPALKELMRAGLGIGYCARIGEVDVRLTAHGPQGGELVRQGEAIVRAALGDAIFGINDESMESVVVNRLIHMKKTLAVAESCTGGFISSRVTDVPGASAVFICGMITYANAAKQALLGVKAETLAAHGAVSEPVAREMAHGARRVAGADFALSVTGIAGPGGGSEAKPVGTVFIGLATPAGVEVRKFHNPFDRQTFKFVTSQQALNLLRLAL